MIDLFSEYVVFLRVIKHIYFPDEINTKYVVIVSLMIISLQCDLKIEFVFLKKSGKIAKSFFLVLRLGEQSRFYCQFCHISIPIQCSLTYNHTVNLDAPPFLKQTKPVKKLYVTRFGE